jgi:hypothetical protein
MPVYTVHAPVGPDGQEAAADRFVFVRDGFHLWAAVFGALWLLVHRLWWVLLGYVVVMALVGTGLALLPVGNDVRVAVELLLALLVGLEAANWRRWTLSRGRWRQLDVVVARNEHEAEHRFFERWAAGRLAVNEPLPADRGAPPPVRGYVGPPAGEVMGLFPQPGRAR